MSFTEFSYICHDLLQVSTIEKLKELAEIKTNAVIGTIKNNFDSIISLGNNLVAYGLAERGHKVYVYGESGMTHPNIYYVSNPSASYDLVLGIDQATTFFKTNQEQQDYCKFIGQITKKTFVTTLMDYKNQSKKMFEEPFYLKVGDKERIVLHHRKWSMGDKQAWNHYVYVTDEKNNTVAYGGNSRRTMYFKQLAKFLYDNGAKDYIVHKEPLYKGVFSKTFQHIVSAEF